MDPDRRRLRNASQEAHLARATQSVRLTGLTGETAKPGAHERAGLAR